MPNIKSAKKRAKQNIKKRLRNKSIISAVRTMEKNLVKILNSDKKEALEDTLRAYSSKISKAKSKGVVKARTASRKISRLSTKVYKALSN